MIGVKIVIGLLGLGLALLPGTTFADPTDQTPKEGQLDPEYAAGKAAIAVKDWNAAIRSLSSAALRDSYLVAAEVTADRSRPHSRECPKMRQCAEASLQWISRL